MAFAGRSLFPTPPVARLVQSPLAAFRAEVEALLRAAVPEGTSLPALEVPPDPAMGDLGMPCFTLAKALRKAPPAIAADLAGRIAPSGWVARVAAAGPYVNFAIDGARLASAVLSDPRAALDPVPAQRPNVLLEHTSANPNGPLHVGRARNPIVGDTLARLYRAAGHKVEVQYYMDNLGRQVATLSWGKWNLDPATLPPAGRDKVDHDLVRYYQAAHDLAKQDPAVAAKVKHLVEELEAAKPELLARVRSVYGACFEGMLQSLHRLGARYDSIKDESDVVLDGSVADTIARLKQLPIAGVDDNGANYLDLSTLLKGQKDKFFFTRGDGTSVYATRDVAYHAWKAKHVAGGVLLNVLGEDHRLQALQVGTALDALGIPRPTVVFYAFVSLPEGKMSTRANRVVFLDDLLDEAAARAYEEVKLRRGAELGEPQLRRIAEAVGVAAVRFNIARIQPEKPIEFRWEEALSFDGDAAPYLMYAYARAASLLRKAKEAGLAPAGAAPPEAGEQKLLATVARFQEAVQEAARQNAPQRFAAYASSLAAAFNEYYRDHRVLECEDRAQQALRLAAVAAAHAALARTLDALGIPALEDM
ncbi:MAG: arginyl-tRNA synthetase [Thermoplasmata archaeon]|jgi:arginyl-tRNA synthetase|nr:arginyl-tRNA synthetase [Thermoplasmata archaeon]